jgi:hypothetical protein
MTADTNYPGPLLLWSAKAKLMVTPLEEGRFRRERPHAFVSTGI